jgi:hypothetical protein
MRIALAWSLLAVIGTACHSTPCQPIPVTGEPADVRAMAGEWDGEYEADDHSRAGSIDFHLRAGSDTAVGDVLMVPRGWERPNTGEDKPGAQMRESTPPTLLYIRFVRVSGGQVSGELERYRDPDCGCLLRTVFLGWLTGDTLSGQYLSYHQEGGPPDGGHWRAVRKKLDY